MSRSSRPGRLWGVSVFALGLLVAGGLAAWLVRGWLGPPPAAGTDGPPDRVVVSLSGQPQTLAFSPDGRWLAGGTWGGLPPHTGPAQDAAAVYLIDPDAKSVTATLELKNYVQAIAFSPDGKLLAVATAPPVTAIPTARPPGELVVCEVPGLAVKHRATAAVKAGFWDVAWAGNGSAVYTVEGLTDYLSTNTVRGWAAPGWAERPAITQPQTLCFSAVAVSPDGKTVAVTDMTSQVGSPVVRLFDTASGQEGATTVVPLVMAPTLAFAADGQAIRADDRGTFGWFDPTTGKTAQPCPLAATGVARSRYSRARAVSADAGLLAAGEMNRTKLVGQGLFDKQNYGAFVELTGADGTRLGRWRLADEYGSPPAVALTADGGRVAATFGTPAGGVVVVWPVPR
ncbi:MAG: hypothetical protein U0871_16920 [Gemmataceae bacterium]